MKKAILINDTSNANHHGCSYVKEAIVENLEKRNYTLIKSSFNGENWITNQQLVELIRTVDLIIVNGEGTLHHSQNTAIELVKIAKFAYDNSIKCVLINSVFQDNNEFINQYMKYFDLIFVRETRSKYELMRIGVDSEVVPDLSFYSCKQSKQNDQKKSIGVTDSVYQQLTDGLYEYAIAKQCDFIPILKQNAGYVSTKYDQYCQASNSEYYEKIANTNFIICARYHSLCLALQAEVPFLAISSNSHKIEGLLEDIGLSCDRLVQYEELLTRNTPCFYSEKEKYKISHYVKNARIAIENMFDAMTMLKIKKCFKNDLKEKNMRDTLNQIFYDKKWLLLDSRNVSLSKIIQKNKNFHSSFSILDIPSDNDSIETIICIDVLDQLTVQDLEKAFREFYRVTKKNLYIRVATKTDRDGHWHLTSENREWWETKLFEAGFRKHSLYYKVNNYTALNEDPYQIAIIMEKIPSEALAAYPLSALEEERNLHMDMTRVSGERSDAHMIRYHLASQYVLPNSRVLDAACGLGYGSYMLASLGHVDSVVAIDGSDYAIDYADKNFTAVNEKTYYHIGFLPDALMQYPDSSFDTIVSFETLEHVEQPKELLKEFYRVLTPGGRIIVSVPNDWSDETGKDPNPHHLHVYTWEKLFSELSEHFIVEEAYAQTASRCKVASIGNQWQYRPRSLEKVDLNVLVKLDCEWWLMVAMKSPLDNQNIPYQERVFSNIAESNHPSLNYRTSYHNPWLQHAIVTYGLRMNNKKELLKLCETVLADSNYSIWEQSAAITVKAYQILEDDNVTQDTIEVVLQKIEHAINLLNSDDPETIRWFVSLSFVKAKLCEKIGDYEQSIFLYKACASRNIFIFGVHLATKVTEALFHAGELSYTLGQVHNAKKYWKQCIEFGRQLQTATIEDILIVPEFPNLFDYGDGVREYTLAWDWIARSANGIHLLQRDGYLKDGSNESLQKSFLYQYQKVTQDMLTLSDEAIQLRSELQERTRRLEIAEKDLIDRTQRLVNTESELIDRTQ
ncbi:MAG: methyltransferase domain-containing protein, partial [Erysipelotrichia bacterium]|nr:methyltransferase domain-containing protein [Erysipelotrichia bacterium]